MEIIKNLSSILDFIKTCKQDIADSNPMPYLYRYPGFNLRIAKWANQQDSKPITSSTNMGF
jgi:lipid-A-disaccharide synthase